MITARHPEEPVALVYIDGVTDRVFLFHLEELGEDSDHLWPLVDEGSMVSIKIDLSDMCVGDINEAMERLLPKAAEMLDMVLAAHNVTDFTPEDIINGGANA